jgi:hypothetical protein
LRRDAITNIRTPEDYLNWHDANHQGNLGAFFKSAGISPSRESIIAQLNQPGGLDKLKRESALGATELQKQLMQTERTRISAGPGYMQANLAREQYDDKLKYGGDVVTTTVPDPDNPGQRIEIQTRRNIRGADLIPLEVQPMPLRVDISPNSATSSYQPSGAGGTPNVLATQVAPQGGGASATTINAMNANAPAPAAPIFARPLPKEPSGTMAGYRKTAEGNLEFIPGGPADPAVQAQQATGKLDAKTLATREAAYPKVTSALKSFEAKTTKFERDITELIENEKGLNEITGFLAGRTDLSALTDKGRRALALFNTITAKGGFSELQDMRNASPTGGALGNVSNQEGKQLIDSFGALSRTQSGDDLRKSLTIAQSDLQNLKTRMREAYDLTYEYKRGGAGPALPSGFVAD